MIIFCSLTLIAHFISPWLQPYIWVLIKKKSLIFLCIQRMPEAPRPTYFFSSNPAVRLTLWNVQTLHYQLPWARSLSKSKSLWKTLTKFCLTLRCSLQWIDRSRNQYNLRRLHRAMPFQQWPLPNQCRLQIRLNWVHSHTRSTQRFHRLPPMKRISNRAIGTALRLRALSQTRVHLVKLCFQGISHRHPHPSYPSKSWSGLEKMTSSNQ